ncbi:uncharacterized protein LOC144712700 [Wolffia australiana]
MAAGVTRKAAIGALRNPAASAILSLRNLHGDAIAASLPRDRSISSIVATRQRERVSGFCPKLGSPDLRSSISGANVRLPRDFLARWLSSEAGNGEKEEESFKMKHQEIEGPTVERDLSALANETRQVLDRMRQSIFNLSRAMGLLAMAQLGLGAWIAYSARPPPEVTVLAVSAFVFPFSVAFLLRRTLKPLAFFNKMEEQGRLQILTLTLQAAKNINALFLRMRVVSLFCVVGISLGSSVFLWTRD